MEESFAFYLWEWKHPKQLFAMNRVELLNRLDETAQWDFVVIGGGATGLGVALDAASRGFRVVLVEQSDFTKSTSSKSTKLVHGGVRYLAQGDVRLVLEALRPQRPNESHCRSRQQPRYWNEDENVPIRPTNTETGSSAGPL